MNSNDWFPNKGYVPPDVMRQPLFKEAGIFPLNGNDVIRNGGNGRAYPKEGIRDIPPPYSSAAIYVGRTMQSTVKSITTTSTKIFTSRRTWPYLIVNPKRALGNTKRVTALASTALTVTTNTQSTYIDVTGYTEAHLFLNITAITGTWDVYSQGYDAVSATWYNTQRVFNTLTATGHSGYAMIGPNSVSDRLAFNFVETVAGGMTCSLGVILKGGYGYSLTNYSQVVYIGGPGVSTSNGFPILPGEYQEFLIGENVEVWAVAAETSELRIFEL